MSRLNQSFLNLINYSDKMNPANSTIDNSRVAVFIFEFGLPPYRKFLLEYLGMKFTTFRVFSGTDRFAGWPGSNEVRLQEIAGFGENRLYFLNPRRLADAAVIFSTFNLRRPHTWLWILLFPRKRWIFFGKGYWRTRNALINYLRAFLLRLSAGYITYTESGARFLRISGYPANKIRVARNTLDIPNPGWTEGCAAFIYVGRLQERKEIALALKVLSASNAKFKIVGGGASIDALKEFVQNSGLQDRVTFYPDIYDHIKLKELFSEAIAYLSPGHVGLGVVHAFSYAVPVITLSGREHGPEFEYCNDSNSYICADESELAYVLRNLNPHSHEHRQRKISALATYQAKLSPMQMLAVFEDLAFTRDQESR